MKFEIKKYPFLITIAIIALAGLFGALFFLKQLSNVFKTPAPAIGLQDLPCQPASQVDLGYPLIGGEVAEFTTNGCPIYVTARKFDHSGILEPKSWTVGIYVGDFAVKPVWDREKDIVTNAVKKISFDEGSYGKLDLAPGKYWLWSSSSDTVIYSCEADCVSNPKKVE